MRSRLVLGVALALVFFALGALSTRWLGGQPAAPSASPGAPADGKDPLILFDTSKPIHLLPDASLRLDLPPDFDAGAGP